MRRIHILLTIGSLSLATALAASNVSNLDTAKWTHDKDSDSVVLRTDPVSGGLDLLVRFTAGHVIPPHSHDSNERLIVVEGKVILREVKGEIVVNTGGFAFLPAHEVQRLSCGPTSRCTVYLSWDGNPQSHPAP